MKKQLLFIIVTLLSIVANAQTSNVKVSMRNGTVITGEMVEFDPLDHIKVKLGNSDISIPMSEVAFVDNLDQFNNLSEKDIPKDTVKAVDHLADYKGFLLEKGNNIYVYSEKEEYETAGAKELKTLLKKDGFWNVVDNMVDAHFTISYIVNLKGRDKATIIISSWRTDKAILLYTTYTDESVLTNRSIASEMYNKHVLPFQKKIEKGTISKSIRTDFTIE